MKEQVLCAALSLTLEKTFLYKSAEISFHKLVRGMLVQNGPDPTNTVWAWQLSKKIPANESILLQRSIHISILFVERYLHGLGRKDAARLEGVQPSLHRGHFTVRLQLSFVMDPWDQQDLEVTFPASTKTLCLRETFRGSLTRFTSQVPPKLRPMLWNAVYHSRHLTFGMSEMGAIFF